MYAPRLVLIAAAASAALYGAGLYFEENVAGPHCCGLTWPTPDPAQAQRLMAKDDPRGTNPAIQHGVAVSVLAARPMESNAWLRLAYANRLKSGLLTNEGRRAVEMSYLVLPYAGPGAPYRISFALENWSQITPRARQDALKEVAIAQKDESAIRLAIREQARRVRDPSGHLAAFLIGLVSN